MDSSKICSGTRSAALRADGFVSSLTSDVRNECAAAVAAVLVGKPIDTRRIQDCVSSLSIGHQAQEALHMRDVASKMAAIRACRDRNVPGDRK
jgi:hypothetical protein